MMDYHYSAMSQAKPLASKNNSKLYDLKYEIASELSIEVPDRNDWGGMTSRECGRIGGNMTRRLVELGKQQLGL